MESMNLSCNMDKVVFLDRDGTINEEIAYLYRTEDLVILPKVPEAIRLLREHGFRIVVVTNQAGIARGYYTEEEMHLLHKCLNEQLKKEDAWIDRFYYCPHHPVHGIGKYHKKCHCRKPETGMFEMAEQEYHIDKSRSYMVGDKRIDVQAGHNYGISGILVGTGYGIEEREQCRQRGEEPFYDFYAETLMDAAEFIIRKGNRQDEGTNLFRGTDGQISQASANTGVDCRSI